MTYEWMWPWKAAPPIQVKHLPSIILKRRDFIYWFGSNPGPEAWAFPRYKRLATGLGHAARILLAINQKHQHMA